MLKGEKTRLDTELKRLLRRVALIQGASSGDVKMREIVVHRKKKSWTVNAHQKTYVRHIAPTGWKP